MSKNPILHGAAILSVLFFSWAEVRAFQTPATAPLPDFDRRTATAGAVSGEQQTATNTLRANLPGAQVQFDSLSGAPSLVSAEFGFLSGPNGQGKAISATAAATVGAADPNRATRAFLLEHRQLFGHGPEALDAATVKREFVTPHSGLKTVVWEQQVEGIPVYEALLISHTTGNGELVNLSSHFLPDPPAAATLGMANRTVPFAPANVSARRAVAIAARSIGEQIEEEGIQPGEVVGGATKRQQFESTVLAGSADAGLVWLPTGRDRMRLCWDVVLTSRARGEMFRVLVDVENGEPLIRHCLTVYISDATYRVYTSDSPSPFSPGHPTPLTTQPAVVPRSLLTLSALNTTASPNGWIDDGVNETRGNNVDAHADRNANNSPDLPRPQGSPSRVFDFPLDLAQSPLTYSNAAIVQLFYWNNFMHDKLYELGFTEAAGNFQNNTFGRGGVGNDAVQADAQDGSGTDNANFSTPPDGSPGRMQMFLFTAPTPDRDGDLDAEVVLHEYTHGLSNRRVGGGVGLSALQSTGMGEGWSDFYGLALLSEPGDNVNGVYAAGGYLTYQLNGLLQNYYYGIRRYPYCTDTNKNPLTFKDIDPAQASAHTGIPRSPIIGTTANEVHNMGEVWCVTLWEARAKLINKHGWAVGNQLILRLVTDGMNLSVANPNFLQARNAILQADQVNNGGANLGELWNAFAKRGMGFSATSPSSSSTSGLHEAFDVPFLPLNLALPAAATEGDGVLSGRIFVPAAPTTNVVVKLQCSDTSQIIVPSTATILAGQTNVTFNLTVVDDLELDGTRTPTITATAPGYATVVANMPVHDNETATLSLAAPGDATEGFGSLVAAVNVSAAPAVDIQVTLISSDTTEIQVPLVVTIPAGQTSAPFNPAIVDDTQIDGDQVATLTAQVVNWTAGVATITVHDNESVGLSVRLPSTAREGDGVLVNAGEVYLFGTLPTNRVVSLTSDDTTELTAPALVTILAGQTNATFNLTIVNDADVDGTQTARISASAPGFTGGLAAMLIFDDESPLPPSNPRPGDLAVNVPANTNLAWSLGTGGGEQILNGGFENGTLDNWVLVRGPVGQFQANNGTFDPPSPDGPLPTFSGSYSAIATETGPGAFYMYQDVTIPAGATFATLSWAHRVRNFYNVFSTLQQFRVEVRNTNNAVLAVAFTTNPGDPLLGDWVQKSFSLNSYIGQKVRIAFWLNPGGFFLDAHMDNISVQTGSPPDPGVTNDVYFGTNPMPGAAEFQGSTIGTSWALPLLAPQTTYYWQIVSRKLGTTIGPIWQFTTRGVDRFVWDPVPSPQLLNQSFPARITARDDFNQTVTSFNGSANLSATAGGGGLVTNAILGNLIHETSSSGVFTLGYAFTPSTNITVTHVRHYFGSKVTISSDTCNDLASRNVVSAPGTWVETPLLTPVQLLAGERYKVGVYTASSYYWRTTIPTTFPNGTINQSIYGTGDVCPSLDAPGGWAMVDLKYTAGTAGTSVPIAPTVANFTDGVWSGNLTVQQPETNVVLRADDGVGHVGLSNPFEVGVTNDISIQVLDLPDPVSVGANLTYSLAVSNTGPASATGVVVSNILPASVSFVSAVSSQGSCTESAGLVRCNLGTIPAANGATITIVAIPRIGGITISNRATVVRAEADPNLANNTAIALTSVSRVDHFEWSAISPTQYVNIPFTATITARHADNGPATNFNGVVSLSGSGAVAVAVSPTSSGNFSNGIWTGSITLLSSAPSMTLLAQDTNGHFGISNPFMASSSCPPPGTPANPTPADGATSVALTASLGWSVGALMELIPPAPTVPSATGNSPTAFGGQVTSMQNGVAVPGAVWIWDVPPNAPPAGAGEQLGAAVIGFDDLAAPCGFIETTRLTTRYAASGVTFAGPGGNDGGAILNQCGSFGVSGFSAPNFLAFNSGSGMADGGVPRGPETLHFTTEVSQVRMLIGSGNGIGQPLAVLAFNSANALVSSNSFILSSVMASVSIPGAGITRLVVSSPASVFVIDDVSFTPNQCPLTYDVYFGTNNPPTDLAAAALTNTTFVPDLLVPATTYYWRVIARSDTAETPGPVWRFTTVVPQAPTIAVQPVSQTVYVGDSPVLEVQAEGAPPLRYQWTFNGMNLLGATNASLILANVQLSQGGHYAVRVSNALGSMLSSTAVLIVNIRPLCATQEGLVSWWRADGNTSDSTGGNHGTVAGDTTYSPGKVQQAYTFDGLGDSVQIVNAPNLQLQNFTVETWIRRLDPSIVTHYQNGVGVIFGYGSGGYEFAIDGAGLLYLSKTDFDRVTAGPGITDTNYHHVALTKMGTNVMLYIDGSGYATPSYGSSFEFTTPAAIGARSDNLTSSFLGSIDELGIYSRALSASEIQVIYLAGSAGKCPPPLPSCTPAASGLISWWRAETNAADSVNGNNGTLQGGAGFATGEAGQSFLFNGADSFVRIPSSPSIKPAGPFTLEAWVNYDQITGPNGGTVVMKGPDAEVPGDWAISISSIRKLRPHVNLNGGWYYFDCATTLNTGVWYHVAMVYDGAAIRGFVNGVQDGIQNVSGTVRTSDNPMKIGTYASLNSPSTTSFFAGRIDELSFYGRALSNSEIQSVFLAGSAGKCGPAGAVPVITGFSPASGSAGASIAITGLNFSPVPSNNIVYFGAVKAFVAAASPTLLNVIVPVGATYAPITETVSGLTAYSRSPFLPTYAGSGTINSASLAPRVTLPTGLRPDRTEIGDLDGDGKADLATANTLDGTIWVYRNVSTSGALEINSFAAPVILQLPGGSDYQLGLALADLDGDGRLDVVAADGTFNFVSVFKNLSSPGNLASNSFSARLDYPTGVGPNHIAVQDLDGDGKPDIATANVVDNTVSVLRNIGAPGVLNAGSFAAPVNFAAGPSPAAVTIADLDGDGKPDLATANASSGSGAMSVLRNVGAPGSITPASFAARVDFAGPNSTVFVATGDLDKDGKQDLILASFLNGQAISVYRNTATPGTINAGSFAARVDFSVGAWAHTVAVGDLDGDGKPDVAVASESPDRLSLFKNTSSPGTFTTGSFAPRVDFPTGYNAWGVSIGDLDGDGRPDLALVNAYDNTLSVYRNLVPAAPVGGSNLDHFTWSHVPSPQFVNVPFPVAIQAHTLNQSASDFAGIVALSGTSDDWTAANALVPGLSGGFADGVWSGTVAISHSGSNLVLRAEDGLGHIGLANPITVVNPPGLQAVHSGNSLTITWPVEPAGFTLETSTDMSIWVPAPPTWVQVGNQQVFEVDLSETSRFYRLRFDRP